MDEKNKGFSCSMVKENLMEMIFFCDKEGNVLDCSDSTKRNLGYLRLEKMKKFQDIFPMIQLEDTGNLTYITNIYRKNETCFPSEIKIKEFEEGFLVLAMDRTKLKMTSSELKHIKETLDDYNKYRTEFVSNITHELRTPVNGIQGMLRTLQETELTPKQNNTVRIIEECCYNMAKIINNLLDFSKLELDKVILESSPFLFKEFLNKIMDFNFPLINEKGLKLIIHVDDDIPEVLVGDEFRLAQILNNLLGNAVKFTKMGHIAFEVTKIREGDDFVELFFMVLDTGIGIAQNNMGRLFQSFSQVDASTTRKYGGTGLGLSICKKLIGMMGGKIKVESEEGKGSVFSFNVVLSKDDSNNSSGINFPSGNFIYEGNGQYKNSLLIGEESQTFSYKDFSTDSEKLREFGTLNNMGDIRAALEKLLICIELDNWEKAENFASVIKNLISEEEEDKELKKAAFKLELIVRREDKEKALSAFMSFDNALKTYYN